MIKRFFVAGIIFCTLSNALLAMEAPRYHHDSISQRTVNLRRWTWPYLKAIWSMVILKQQQSFGPAKFSKNALITDCNGYMAIAYNRKPTHVRDDSNTFASLLKNPATLLLTSTRSASLPAEEEFLELCTRLATSPADIFFVDGSSERWSPAEASIPYAITTGNTSFLQHWLNLGFGIEDRFHDYKHASMLHLAANYGSKATCDFLLKNGASPRARDDEQRTVIDVLTSLKREDILRLIATYDAIRSVPQIVGVPSYGAPVTQMVSQSTLLPVHNAYGTPVSAPKPPLLIQIPDQNQPPSEQTIPKLGNSVIYKVSQNIPPQIPMWRHPEATKMPAAPIPPKPWSASNIYNLPTHNTSTASAPNYWSAPNVYSQTMPNPPAAPSFAHPSASVSAAPNQPPRRAAAGPNMYLNRKYLPTDYRVPSPIAHIPDGDHDTALPEPDYTLRKINKSAGYRGPVHVVNRYFDGAIHYRVLSKNDFNYASARDYRRNTFVLAGRGSRAAVPLEDGFGRVFIMASPPQADEARAWLADNRDVIVIDALWNQFGQKIPHQDLGLVTSRRLAALQLARIYKLPHIMMLDDNLKHLFISKQWQHKAKTWPEFYTLFQVVAHENQSGVLSAHALNYKMVQQSLDGRGRDVRKNDQASKIFFINMTELTSRLTMRDYPWLFPERFDVCGEDLFFQMALSSLGVSIDTLSTHKFAYSRSLGSRNAALDTIEPADFWAVPARLPSFAPAFHRYAATRLTEIYHENLLRIEEKNDQRRSADLPALTAENNKRLERKRRDNPNLGLRVISDDVRPIVYKDKLVIEKRRKVEKENVDENTFNALPDVPSKIGPLLSDTLDIILNDQRFFPSPGGQPLMDHQYEALWNIKSMLEQGKKRGFIELPTGTGKTRLFLTLIAIAIRTKLVQDLHIAILAPTVQLVDQTYEAIMNFNKVMAPLGLEIPVEKMVTKVSTGNVPQLHLPHNRDFKGRKSGIYIFCDQSFENLITEYPQSLNQFSVVVVDEIQVASTTILATVAKAAAERELLFFGFSATPRDREFFFREPIYRLSIEEAVRRKVLCSWVNMTLGDWDQEDDARFRRLAQGFKDRRHPNGRIVKDTKSIIWVANTEEAVRVAAAFRAAGMPAHSFTSNNDKDDLRELLRRFALKDGSQEQINVLIAVHMLNMGFDGNVDTVVITKNVAEHIARQILGRALRLDQSQPDKIALLVTTDAMFDKHGLEAPGHDNYAIESFFPDLLLKAESPVTPNIFNDLHWWSGGFSGYTEVFSPTATTVSY